MITLKSPAQLDGIRRSADLLSTVFSKMRAMIQPGVSTDDINRMALECIRGGGGKPAFLNYEGFPAAVCTSVNKQVIHGIPNPRPLKEGDIVGCDIGVILDDYYSDASCTYAVGVVSPVVAALLKTTEKALYIGIDACRPGKRVKDVGKAVSKVVLPMGYGIVRNYCGHGVGLALHEDPQIPNYYPAHGENPRFKPGMVLAIEPMINAGTGAVTVLDDGWTVITADGSLSAHFEHTVLVTENEPEVLTSWEASL